jgi:hypothetical protein
MLDRCPDCEGRGVRRRGRPNLLMRHRTRWPLTTETKRREAFRASCPGTGYLLDTPERRGAYVRVWLSNGRRSYSNIEAWLPCWTRELERDRWRPLQPLAFRALDRQLARAVRRAMVTLVEAWRRDAQAYGRAMRAARSRREGEAK